MNPKIVQSVPHGCQNLSFSQLVTESTISNMFFYEIIEFYKYMKPLTLLRVTKNMKKWVLEINIVLSLKLW